MESYIKNFGKLTEEENRALKKQRRMIKNRESAKATRVRRKAYIESLEINNKALESKCKSLERELQECRATVRHYESLFSEQKQQE